MCESIKHLCYLEFSFTTTERLSDSMCDLYNLQTMLLSGICGLIEMLARMDKLINLRYLDISGWKEMPSHIS